MDVLVWNNGAGAMRYSINNLNDAHVSAITRDSMESDIFAISDTDFCSMSIAPTYVKDEIENNDILMILKKENEAKGFIMARSLADQGVYLDVICTAEGLGSSFIKFFMTYCEEKGAQYVELSSLINVLAFYPILGFEHRKDCIPGKGANIAMSKELLDHLKQGKKEGRLKDYTNYYKDPYMMHYAMELHRKGYTKTKNPEICKSKTLSGPRFRQYHCARDGFSMRKCFGIPVVQSGYVVSFEPIAETVRHTKLQSKGTMSRAMASRKNRSKSTAKATAKAKAKAKGTLKKRSAISLRELASLGIPTSIKKNT